MSLVTEKSGETPKWVVGFFKKKTHSLNKHGNRSYIRQKNYNNNERPWKSAKQEQVKRSSSQSLHRGGEYVQRTDGSVEARKIHSVTPAHRAVEGGRSNEVARNQVPTQSSQHARKGTS